MVIRLSSSTSGESFTIVTSTGGSKTATLSRAYPAGTYLIESKAMDANLEVYLGTSDGTQVGSATAGAKTITASASFLYVTTVNADANDAVIFTLKSASTLAAKTDAVWAPPTITDITPSGLPNVNNTTTITGTNFATNVDVKFRKSDDSTLVTPKSTVRGSATSIIATRPDSFAVGDAPYDVIVTNPSTNLSATSLNAITAGAVPVWVTSTTLNPATLTQAFSQTISATDADGGSSVTYAIVSGSFHDGLLFNTNTGAITGTPTGSASTDTITISATDSGGNTVNRTFTQAVNPNGVTVEYLVIAGGGGGGRGANEGYGGGGGGAGGYRSTSSLLNIGTQYNITVGGGGTGGSGNYASNMTNGINSSIIGTGLSYSATGGGFGATVFGTGSSGGSGGGGGGHYSGTGAPGGAGNAGGYSPVEGYNGGSGQSGGSAGAGGGGGAGGVGANATTSTGGIGSNAHSTWASATSSGVSGYYAGGGGGGSAGSGAGGAGGGGAGQNGGGASASGTTNTGSGGGGNGNGTAGGNGGSGIVILRTADTIATATHNGAFYNTGGYKYYKFTANGNITF